MALRYYIYISDAKVDMLLPQIDGSAKRKIAKELSVDLKIISAKRSLEVAQGEDRVLRLEVVARYLRDLGDLGSVDAPAQFFQGEMEMKWGPYESSGLVYFGGETTNTVLGLGGSGTHLIGADERQPTSAFSLTPYLLNALSEKLDESAVSPREEETALQAVTMANHYLEGPAQRVEFVAKRLLGDGGHVLLGSPLYVALLD
jgi:hypothetical protein